MNFLQKCFSASLFLFASIFCFDFHYSYKEKDPFTRVHILEVNPKYYTISSIRAIKIKDYSRETVLSIAKRVNAIAAINGGFWKENGDPAGILKSFGRFYGYGKKSRGAIGWRQFENRAFFDRIPAALNEEKNIELYPELEKENFKKWNELDHIVGGAPLLIKNNKIIEDHTIEKIIPSFLYTKHSRTAIGILENGNWVFVVVDGSIRKLTGGMTIEELGIFMKDFGCVDALNLDGGSSSTMVIENSIMNYPFGYIYEDGKYVRAVSDAIVIIPKD